MKNFTIYSLFILLNIPAIVFCQPSNFQTPVSINEDGTNPDKSAMLDIQSTDKGLLIPRLPYCDIEKIAEPAEGLMIYDTEFHCLRIYIQGKWHCLYQNLNGPNAQYNITGWANPTFGEDFNTSIAIDSKENLYVTMVTEDDEIRLTKFDKKGNILWNILDNSGDKHGYAAVDLDDNIFTIASTEDDSKINFNGVVSQNSGDFITKTSPDGNTTKVFALPGASFKDLDIGPDGNVFFTFTFLDEVTFNGTTYINNLDNVIKVGIAKLDNNLQEESVTILDVYADQIGGYRYDIPVSIAVDKAGDVYIAGCHTNGVEQLAIDPAKIKTYNIFAAKLTGQQTWVKNYGSDNRLSITGMEIPSGFLLVGIEEDDPTGQNQFISKNAKILRYISSYGGQSNTIDPPGREYYSHFTVNEAGDEIVFTYTPYNSPDGNIVNEPAKLLVYKYSVLEPSKVVTQTFYSAGNLIHSNDGTKIYGIAKGTVIGNSIIEQEPGSENHIIYKIYNE